MAVTVAGIVEPASRTGTTDPWTWSHDQGTSSPQGVLVGIVHGTSATDHVTGVTYGGVALARAQRNTDTVTELGAAEWWFLGNSVPTGTQTVSVDLSSGTTDDFTGISITLNGLSDLQVVDSDGVSEQATNPSVTLQYSGRTCMAFAAQYSGLTANSDITANETTITKIGTVDLAGNFTSAFLRQVTAGSADFAMASISASDDCAYAVVAVSESAFFPSAADTVNVIDTATVVRQIFWYGRMHLLNQPHVEENLTISDDETVLIPIAGILQIPASALVTIQDASSILETPVHILRDDTLTATDDTFIETIDPMLVIADASDSLTVSDAASVGVSQWSGDIRLFIQPQASEVVTLDDVETVGNDRAAEIAWIELEVPASSTEVDVPFGQLQSGQIRVQLKYRGHTNKVRGILATNASGQSGTFVIDDNGTEHLVTIPAGAIDQVILLDEEVTVGNGVDVKVWVEKVSQ